MEGAHAGPSPTKQNTPPPLLPQVIWQVINHGHCAFKVKTAKQVRGREGEWAPTLAATTTLVSHAPPPPPFPP